MLTHSIDSLFSVPIYQSKEPHNITEDELNFFKSLDVKDHPCVSPSKDFNVLEHPELSSIKKYIKHHLDTYTHDVLKITKDLEFYFTESWANYMSPGGSHPLHTHPNSIVSGVFFVHGDPCPIHFRNNENFPFRGFEFDLTERNHLNSNFFEFLNYPGILLLFPSTTPHEVSINQSEFVRVSLSFNTFVKGQISKVPSTSLCL